MQAKVTKAFAGRPDDKPTVREFAVDDIVTGDLAAVAVAQKWAEPFPDPAEQAKAEAAAAKKAAQQRVADMQVAEKQAQDALAKAKTDDDKAKAQAVADDAAKALADAKTELEALG